MTKQRANFNDSFFWRVKLRAGRGHTLKHHARRGTVIYELLGILDLLAAEDELKGTRCRFVFASIAALVDMCNKGERKNGIHYTETWVKEALAELRARHIISGYFTAQDGRKGFIVAPHDSLCYRDGAECVLHAPKRYDCSDETAELLRETGNPPVVFFPVAQPAETLPETLPQTLPLTLPQTLPQTLPINEKKAAPNPTAHPTAGTPQPADEAAVIETQSEIWHASGTENGAPNRVTVITRGTERTEKTENTTGLSHASASDPDKEIISSSPAPKAAQGLPGVMVASSSGACAPGPHDLTAAMKKTTIGQRFAACADDVELLQEISDGEYNPYAYKTDIDDLARYARVIVAEISGQPWDGLRDTCARIMDAVAKRMQRDRVEYPAGWLAVLKQLQKGGPCKTKTPPARDPSWPAWQKHYGPPNAQDVMSCNARGFELCSDWLCRDEKGRAAEGFTVKNAEGIWEKGSENQP
jgi:hypothetical protein